MKIRVGVVTIAVLVMGCKGDAGGGEKSAEAKTGEAKPSAAAKRTGFADPPFDKDRAIVRTEARFDAPEAGRIPWGAELEIVDKLPDGSWFGVKYSPILGERKAWIHRDVFKPDLHPPATRPTGPVPYPGWGGR